MTWNYRIVRHHQPSEWFGLHEVFYDDSGSPMGITAEPIGFISDGEEGPEGIIRSLEMALNDAKRHPVLDETAIAASAPPPAPPRD